MGQLQPVSAEDWDREVTSSPLPVLVEFWSRHSDPCRFEDPVLEAVAEGNHGVKILRVDVEAEPLLAERYAVRALPTMILFVDGGPVHHMVGYHEAPDLERQLAGYLN